MTKALEEWETPKFFKRRSMDSFWRMRKDIDMFNIWHSLENDKRFYEAEYYDD